MSSGTLGPEVSQSYDKVTPPIHNSPSGKERATIAAGPLTPKYGQYTQLGQNPIKPLVRNGKKLV